MGRALALHSVLAMLASVGRVFDPRPNHSKDLVQENENGTYILQAEIDGGKS